MKRIISILFFLFIAILPLQVKALSVSKNNLTIEKGESETVDLYAEVDSNVTEVSFSLVYTSYDVPAYFNIESGLRDEASGIRHKIVFSVPVTGKIKLGTVKINVVASPKVTAGAVNIHSATAVTSDGETINLETQMINVAIETTTEVVNTEPSVPEEDNKDTEKTNLLSKIESDIVNINLKDGVYEYTVNVKESVEELDLKPIAKDEKYEIKVSTQKIDELENNEIIITVKDGENTEEYKIKVKVISSEEVKIDNEEFESTFKYKWKWITLIVILSLVLVVGLFLNKKQ